MRNCVLMFVAFIAAVSIAAIMENKDINRETGAVLLDNEKQDSLFAHEMKGEFIAKN